MKQILTFLFALILLAGGLFHLIEPDFYEGITPDFVPLALANVVASVVEIAIGIALLVPKSRKLGALTFTFLMLAFLPIHIWDLCKEVPAVGTQTIAVFRLIVQFGLICGGFWLCKKLR